MMGHLEALGQDRSPAPGLEERRGPRKRVIVIGAGMAGLGAAYELAEQGHDPVVLEAQNRVGGRLLTLRCFAPGLYAEAGGMRIPRVHELTLDYCRRLGVALRPFIMDCPEAPMYLAGRRVTYAAVQRHPVLMPLKLAAHERDRTWAQLWEDATRDVRQRFEREGEGALAALGREFDHYSIRGFLTERGFSEDALELYGLMSFRESNMRAAVTEQLREIVGRAFEDMQEVVGGMDRLPAALFARLRSRVRLGAHVFAVEQDADGVTVHFRRPGGGTESVTGDACICTIPFGILTHVDFRPALSRGKYRAVRELNYNPSTKVLLQVRNRFWEKHGIVGGATVTDLPIRRIVYPSHPPEDGDPRGVLLASYTWGQDAARWGALSADDRIEFAIRDVAKIHPEIREECEGGASYAWYDDPYAVGAFALFEPGQETALHAHIIRPEGRVYFAGEHCSLWHAWIQGALESGLSAAAAVVAAR
jgi:monoamine oxidase